MLSQPIIVLVFGNVISAIGTDAALADLLLVDGDPLANIDILGNPQNNFVLIMKDGKIYKNALNN